MTFGQIEQSWFEDDLWTLHSMPPAPEQRKVIEQNRQDHWLVETTAPVAADADVTDAPFSSAKVSILAVETHR